MTNLTEKWKKGELPEGFYYVKDGGNMIAEYLDGYFYNNGEPMTSFSGGVDEVLAPVPSYEQWQQLKEYERIVKSYYGKPIDYDIACETVNKLLDEQNFLKEEISAYKRRVAELKELLKEVLRHELSLKEISELTRKISEVLGEE